MLAYFDSTPGWGELLKRTVEETQADNGLGSCRSARLATLFGRRIQP
jgi:hypothetical protein